MFKTGDIVRFKYEHGIAGLYEIVALADHKGVIVTNDACNHERYADTSWLIFVCSVDMRLDI